MKLFSNLIDKISVETIKLELMKTAYGTQDTFLSKLDSRILILWYLIFAILPWLFFNKTIIIALLIFMIVIASMSKVSKLIVALLSFSLIAEFSSIFIVSYFFGGGMESLGPLVLLSTKLVIIALASISVFASMDPEKFSDALLSFGLSGRYCFGVSYGYRILPLLFEEYNNIFNSFRLRGKMPEKKGFLGWRYIYYYIKVVILGFYPMILNTAKRTRTTVEALELKGFTYSLDNDEVKRLKLSYMKIGKRDILFLASSICIVAIIITIGQIYPL
ncbi:energy-coupling factor transporter transmembrane component T family protein [Orenia marismortui]|uniref:energy-coupling factor transporter transmembrane component T family protein n=1 Tax=Orenia marismortui TaxID=46469 RepID=UPI00036970CB|nr:energy-coupling factor transporter transmembrane component T [Orenia marismortui]